MKYKAETTLNERDSLTDLYLTERFLESVYANALGLGCSKGFLTMLKNHIVSVEKDRLMIFMLMTEHDYAGVNTCDEERQSEIIDRFLPRIKTIKN